MTQNLTWVDWIFGKTWVVELIIILLLLLLLNFVLRGLLASAKRKGRLIENDWRLHLDYVAVRPVQLLIWVFLIAFTGDLLIRESELEGSFVFLPALRDCGVVICLAWALLRWKKIFHDSVVAQRMKGQTSFDPLSLELVSKLFTLAVIFVVFLLILQILGLNIIPLITFGGIGAAALAFASKDVFANFFGGLMLNLTRPFTVNDQVELPHRKVVGHIEEIGWYLTVIRDLQKKPIYLPNSIFASEILINISRMTHRRIEETIGLRYADISHAAEIVDEVRKLFQSDINIDHSLPIYVFVQSLAPSSVDLEVKAYTLSTRYEEFMEIKQKILLQIYEILESRGAELAYPTMTVRM